MIKKVIARLHHYPQSVRFLIAGCYNTAVGYAIFLLLYALFYPRLGYLAILALSYAISGANGFVSMRYIVFRDFSGPWFPAYLRSQVSYVAVLALNAGLMIAFVEWLQWWIPLAQLIATCLCVAASYAAHRYFTFR